jgi:hypothetical protein
MNLFGRAVVTWSEHSPPLSERRALLAVYSGWRWWIYPSQALYTDSVTVRLGYQMNIHVN